MRDDGPPPTRGHLSDMARAPLGFFALITAMYRKTMLGGINRALTHVQQIAQAAGADQQVIFAQLPCNEILIWGCYK